MDPASPDRYRLTWRGRFSLPFGVLLLERTASEVGLPAPVGTPVAYGPSVGVPELPVREIGLGETALANLDHFVGHPAAAWTVPRSEAPEGGAGV